MRKSAVISTCKNYRYELTRKWRSSKPRIVFVGLNPSTADASTDDQTIKKLTTYAKQWGYGSFTIVNVFAFRSRDAYAMLKVPNYFGPDNMKYLKEYAAYETVVIMWGSKANEINRWRTQQVLNMIPDPWCFGKNKDGSPKHPLMLPYKVGLIKYR